MMAVRSSVIRGINRIKELIFYSIFRYFNRKFEKGLKSLLRVTDENSRSSSNLLTIFISFIYALFSRT